LVGGLAKKKGVKRVEKKGGKATEKKKKFSLRKTGARGKRAARKKKVGTSHEEENLLSPK